MTGRAAVRLDKWLWAARFYKTRATAAAAIDGGKVQVNGVRVKRSRLVHEGDQVRVRKGPYEYQLVVREPGDRRRSAVEAADLYEETAASRDARERLSAQLRLAAAAKAAAPTGRPTKRDRRQIRRFKDGG